MVINAVTRLLCANAVDVMSADNFATVPVRNLDVSYFKVTETHTFSLVESQFNLGNVHTT